MRKHHIFGVRIDEVDKEELFDLLSLWLNGNTTRTIVTPNPEFVLLARADATVLRRLNDADLSLPDGVGLRYAVAALSDGSLRTRQTGVDTLEQLAALCASAGKGLCLYGGGPGIAERAADVLRSNNPGLSVRAVDPGQVGDQGVTGPELAVLTTYPVVAFALGMGKQERVMESYLAAAGPQTATRIVIGVGGALDMIAGVRRRAPGWMRRSGVEWAWRAIIEPARIRRIFRATVVFPIVVISATLRQGRFLFATYRVAAELLGRPKTTES